MQWLHVKSPVIRDVSWFAVVLWHQFSSVHAQTWAYCKCFAFPSYHCVDGCFNTSKFFFFVEICRKPPSLSISLCFLFSFTNIIAADVLLIHHATVNFKRQKFCNTLQKVSRNMMKMFEICVNEWIEVRSDWEWFEWRSVPGILNCGFLIVFTCT